MAPATTIKLETWYVCPKDASHPQVHQWPTYPVNFQTVLTDKFPVALQVVKLLEMVLTAAPMGVVATLRQAQDVA